MRVYSVIEIEMSPYGDDNGEGGSFGVFKTRKSANAYIKELIDCHRFNYTDRKTGKVTRRDPKYVVRSFKLED